MEKDIKALAAEYWESAQKIERRIAELKKQKRERGANARTLDKRIDMLWVEHGELMRNHDEMMK